MATATRCRRNSSVKDGAAKLRVAHLDDMTYGAAVELLWQQFEKGGETGFVDESHARSELP